MEEKIISVLKKAPKRGIWMKDLAGKLNISRPLLNYYLFGMRKHGKLFGGGLENHISIRKEWNNRFICFKETRWYKNVSENIPFLNLKKALISSVYEYNFWFNVFPQSVTVIIWNSYLLKSNDLFLLDNAQNFALTTLPWGSTWICGFHMLIKWWPSEAMSTPQWIHAPKPNLHGNGNPFLVVFHVFENSGPSREVYLVFGSITTVNEGSTWILKDLGRCGILMYDGTILLLQDLKQSIFYKLTYEGLEGRLWNLIPRRGIPAKHKQRFFDTMWFRKAGDYFPA